MLDGRVLGASQVEYKPFGKPPLKREESRAKVGILPRKKMSRLSSKPTTVKKIQWSCGGTTVKKKQWGTTASAPSCAQYRIAPVSQKTA